MGSYPHAAHHKRRHALGTHTLGPHTRRFHSAEVGPSPLHLGPSLAGSGRRLVILGGTRPLFCRTRAMRAKFRLASTHVDPCRPAQFRPHLAGFDQRPKDLPPQRLRGNECCPIWRTEPRIKPASTPHRLYWSHWRPARLARKISSRHCRAMGQIQPTSAQIWSKPTRRLRVASMGGLKLDQPETRTKMSAQGSDSGGFVFPAPCRATFGNFRVT